MDLSKISTGKNPPRDINVVVEIPQGGPPVKYELDKDSGAMFVDRFLHTSMVYPVNYGFVPGTLSDDGDPADVMVLTPAPIIAGVVVRCRPIGALVMEDESGQDEKILAVPVEKLHPYYADIKSHSDLPKIFLEQIEHFFVHYKDLEKGKWVKVKGWVGVDEAEKLIEAAIANYNKK
ncbi:MAG TPA: inorganic diphosphatase [Stellaceae bacterium]|jgi:inorganic pyrophosphatase|nr:inorganic diphosphatase [Stellaceae bacterium]